MRLGVIVSPAGGYGYEEIAAVARESEAAGFESFWVSDHFFGGKGEPDRACLEAWTLLAALARDTKSVRLGTLVTAHSYRNPALLAKIVAGVDQFSGGRVDFGIGAGWKEDEYRAYGFDFPPPAVRVAQLGETLEIVRRLWTEDRATFHGKHYRIDDAVCAPKPVQKPHPPIWIGGGKPRIMRLAARYADGFDLGRRTQTRPHLTADEMRAGRAELAEACRAVGRTRPIAFSHWAPAKLDGSANGEGSADALLERIRGYAAAGLDQYLLAFPRDSVRQMVERAAREVIPRN